MRIHRLSLDFNTWIAVTLFCLTTTAKTLGQELKTVTRIEVKKQPDFNTEEVEKFNQAVALMYAAINSAGFKNRVLDFKYKEIKQFNENRKKSNKEVLKMFLSGAEATNPRPDNVIELNWEISGDCPRRAIGTTYGKERTETYRCKLEDMTAAELAGHIAHEYCHYLGFGHNVEHNAGRKFTVPYAIGYIVGALCSAEDNKITSKELEEISSIFEKAKKTEK